MECGSLQINSPHIAEEYSRSQKCNVTLYLELNGHTRPAQEPIPPDVGYGTVRIHDPIMDDSQFDEVRLGSYSL